MSSTSSRKLQRGAAALEFALVVPVLILLVLGIVDFGNVMSAQSVVANSAREGARAASLGSTSAEADAKVRAAMSLPGAEDPIKTAVNVACTDAALVEVACGLSTNSGGTVVVTVTHEHAWISPALLGLADTITITQTSKMRIE